MTLQNRLKEKDVPPEVASLEFIRDLITAVPTSANIKYYATIVSEKAVLRKLIRLTEEIANNCYSEKDGLEVILEDTKSGCSIWFSAGIRETSCPFGKWS